MDASGTKSSKMEAHVEDIRQQWRDNLREEEDPQTRDLNQNSFVHCQKAKQTNLHENDKVVFSMPFLSLFSIHFTPKSVVHL